MVTDELPPLLEQWALDIDRDGTPSQAGPSVEELRQLAQSLRASLQAMQARAEAAERERDEWKLIADLSAWADGLDNPSHPYVNTIISRAEAAEARVKELEEMQKALAVYWEWMVSVATLGELADLERRMAQVGITLQRLGEFTAAMEEAIQP